MCNNVCIFLFEDYLCGTTGIVCGCLLFTIVNINRVCKHISSHFCKNLYVNKHCVKNIHALSMMKKQHLCCGHCSECYTRIASIHSQHVCILHTGLSFQKKVNPISAGETDVR